MQLDSTAVKPLVACGVAQRPLPGQAVCGDSSLVQTIPGGVLMAALDGLGHGAAAAAAAHAALGALERHAGEPLGHLVERCHAELTSTRGAVMALGSLDFEKGRLTWLGVGNVEGVLWRDGARGGTFPARLVPRSGVVGYQLPPLSSQTVAVAQGDWVIFATDGISAGFTQSLFQHQTPQQLAERILARHFKGTDDALVLVVRYMGPSCD